MRAVLFLIIFLVSFWTASTDLGTSAGLWALAFVCFSFLVSAAYIFCFLIMCV